MTLPVGNLYRRDDPMTPADVLSLRFPQENKQQIQSNMLLETKLYRSGTLFAQLSRITGGS
jgi:hypothetical protein